MDKIAAGLERDGILTGAGGKKWHTSTINKILRNEKYIGDALLQKTYTTDFLNKTRVKNNGLVPQYLSLIHISEPTRRTPISYAVFCLKKKKTINTKKTKEKKKQEKIVRQN